MKQQTVNVAFVFLTNKIQKRIENKSRSSTDNNIKSVGIHALKTS